MLLSSNSLSSSPQELCDDCEPSSSTPLDCRTLPSMGDKESDVFICDAIDCYKVFESEVELRYHRYHRHSHPTSNSRNEELAVCRTKHCDKHWECKEPLEEQRIIARRYGSDLFTCDFQGCYKTFKSDLGVRLHKAQCHRNGRPLECLYKDCHKTFKYRRSHRNHVEKHFGKIV